ncbi:OmpA family protein [Ostreibacterium oceani]|uniref:OmpA family protein n=1 Tax=Ostreibacterium oceani TaxID=2654998 RepID=A0A6N7EX10_9GAMM|nr:OmpA family protein [Ostreibacterium oceani]MPV86080.1 OmpA family protein [Ostreibacterium oceani]
MKGNLSLAIVATFVIGISGCSTSYHHNQHHGQVFNAPGLITQPFRYTGRTWFDTDKAVLKPQGQQELDGLASHLMQAKSRGVISDSNRVVVIGHTDSRASHAYNQKLSERRAAAVATYLQGKGIPSSAIVAKGKGETQPVASNRTRAGMQKNRRVEIHIEGPSIKVVYN